MALIDQYWSATRTAEELGVVIVTLRSWRNNGIGPAAYLRGSRWFYKADEVQAWMSGAENEHNVEQILNLIPDLTDEQKARISSALYQRSL